MTSTSALLAFVLFGLGAQAATTKCVKTYAGVLATNSFADASGEFVFRSYFLNSRGEVSYDPSKKKHDFITVEYQACTPNYAQEPNNEVDGNVYGRFYIPSTQKCLAVTNPSSNPPYYIGTQACPPLNRMAAKDSIPFNFVSNESGGEFDIRWVGGTIPSKPVYQGPNPLAQSCYGEYFVNSTNIQHGHNFNGLGEPVTSAAKDELYRVHLYCPNRKGGEGTGFNSFTVIDPRGVSN